MGTTWCARSWRGESSRSGSAARVCPLLQKRLSEYFRGRPTSAQHTLCPARRSNRVQSLPKVGTLVAVDLNHVRQIVNIESATILMPGRCARHAGYARESALPLLSSETKCSWTVHQSAPVLQRDKLWVGRIVHVYTKSRSLCQAAHEVTDRY